MEVPDYVATAESEQNLLLWKQQHPHAFLSYFLIDGGKEQVGFYHEASDKVFSVAMDEEQHVLQAWEDDVFRDPEKKVHLLQLDTVTFPLAQLKEKAERFFSEKYAAIPFSKILYLLETIEGFGTVWNITFVTRTTTFVILKIHPQTGEIIEERKESLTV